MKRQKLQITLPEELKSRIQAEAKEDFMSVSFWVERAMVSYLSQNTPNKSMKKDKTIDLGI